LRSGRFADAEDVLLEALRSSETATGADLVAAMQASPYSEVEIEPSRDRMPVRTAPAVCFDRANHSVEDAIR